MKVNLIKEKCIMCGMCEIVCPHQVFSSDSSTLEIVNEPDCIECGACQINCPTGALYVDSGVG